MADNLPEGLMFFSFPEFIAHDEWRGKHREVRRKARVVSIFPNKAFCLRLVSAVLSEISDEWVTARTYLTFQGSD
jgi:transposase-like protein